MRLSLIIGVFLIAKISFAFPFPNPFPLTCVEKWEIFNSKYDLPKSYLTLVNKCNDEFRRELKRLISTNSYSNYKAAKKYMFDNFRDEEGYICGVYSDLCTRRQGVPNSRIMNCEHSWPKSRVSTTAAADLHHLYPSDSYINSLRDRLPFCEIDSFPTWSNDSGSAIGRNERGRKCFEAPDFHKGRLARSMMYISVRYGKYIDSTQEYFFRKWSKEFPVTDWERTRDQYIYEYQDNHNPFVLAPALIDFIVDF